MNLHNIEQHVLLKWYPFDYMLNNLAEASTQ